MSVTCYTGTREMHAEFRSEN